MNYLRFFFGTPRRLLATLVVIGVILAMIFPNVLAEALRRFTYAIAEAMGPLVGIVLAVIIVFAGLRIIFGGKK